MPRAYLGLGSNMGDRQGILDGAIEALDNTADMRILSVAPLYETRAWGFEEQASFLNTVVAVQTTLDPYQLLAACQAVEATFDRKREIKWGPRTLDIDILLYDQLEIADQDLTIPHPLMHERAFVLAPLAEISPQSKVRGRSIAEWLALLDLEKEGVRRMSDGR